MIIEQPRVVKEQGKRVVYSTMQLRNKICTQIIVRIMIVRPSSKSTVFGAICRPFTEQLYCTVITAGAMPVTVAGWRTYAILVHKSGSVRRLSPLMIVEWFA